MLSYTVLSSLFVAAVAKQVVISVGEGVVNSTNTSSVNPDNIFDPQEVNATVGDEVIFAFKGGSFSVIQSTFDEPCIHAHDTNSSINGFDTGARATNNGTSLTNFSTTIQDNNTVWFYELTYCGLGGVGAINVIADSNETFDGYVRNAERLFGPNDTDSSSSSSPSSTGGRSSSPSSTQSPSSGSSGAERALIFSTPLAVLGVVALFL